ncbi:MAG: permease-like cell division protein FtsX [Oscillospiraceae bacterium]|nr:permease-like cell division protein FtsX [Oscillospiraceae bacterium]
MKNNGSLGYLTREGFRNLYVNRLMSIASISVLFSCMVMIGAAFMLMVNINMFIGSVEDQNVIMVFVEDEATQEQTKALGESIKAQDNVSKCTFISRESSFEQLKNDMGDSSVLFEGLDSNPLPDAYEVVLEDQELFDETVESLAKLDNVLHIRENRQLAAKLSGLRNTVSYVSIGIISLLLIVSLFIVSNTIRITMDSRRLEINIMKSVGATRWFIRWPFMVEGMMLGVISGVLALLAVWAIYAAVSRSLVSMLSGLGMTGVAPFGKYALILLAVFLGLGLVAGAFGSAVSITRYLREKEFVVVDE